jgi:hypothetical protein
MTNYTTGLQASKAIKEAGIEIETEKYWNDKKELRYRDGFLKDDGKFIASSPSLSELGNINEIK